MVVVVSVILAVVAAELMSENMEDRSCGDCLKNNTYCNYIDIEYINITCERIKTKELDFFLLLSRQ